MMARLIFILISVVGNCLIAATIPLEQPRPIRLNAATNRIEEKFRLSIVTTDSDSAFNPPPIDIFHEASPLPHPTALRLTSLRGYERVDLREEQRARAELANYYTQTWLKHFTRQWFAGSAAAKKIQKLNEMMNSRSVALVEASSPSGAQEKGPSLLLNYGYSLLEDRGHVEIQGQSWRAGIELGQLISGEIQDFAARTYLHARYEAWGPQALAECENRTKRCRFSLSQPLPGGLGASVEAISRMENEVLRLEQAGVFVTYQGPIPFLSM